MTENILEQKYSQKIVRFFPNTDMRNGHAGLEAMAKEHRVSTSNLARGEFLIFLNSAKTVLKLFTAGNIIVHLRMPQGEKIDLGVISLIPTYFNGNQIRYKEALREKMLKELTVQGKKIKLSITKD